MADKVIKQDGKRYLFKPGKEGSLTVTDGGRIPAPFTVDPKRVSRVVPALQARRRRIASVGSTRG